MTTIIDIHCHFGHWPFPIPAHGKAETLRLMERFGISLGIFSSAKAVVYDFREGNRELAAVIAGEPRMRGYVVINPNYPQESRRELDTYLARPEFVGIKCHAAYTGVSPSSPAFRELAPHLTEYGCPIKYHADLREVATVAREIPELRFIVPHQGFVNLGPGETPPPNVYADFCGTATDRDRVRALVQALGADHVLFGTDLTLINPAMVLGMIEEAELAPQDKELILWGNAVQLFNLEV